MAADTLNNPLGETRVGAGMNPLHEHFQRVVAACSGSPATASQPMLAQKPNHGSHRRTSELQLAPVDRLEHIGSGVVNVKVTL